MNDNKIAKKKLNFHESDALSKNSYKKYEPKEKRYFVRDTKLEGFWIRVFPSGTKSYGITTRKGGIGKPKLITIGNSNLISFEDAKETAKKYLLSIKINAENPKETIKKESIKNKTILDLVSDFIELRKTSLSEFTIKDYKARVTNRMKPLLNTPVNELSKDDIVGWWKSCPKLRSDVIAFTYARKVFSVAVADMYISSNPFNAAKELIGSFPAIPERNRLVDKSELSSFFEAFLIASKSIKVNIRDYLIFILVTGKRKGEVEQLTWDNVDFKKGVITLNKTKTKKIDILPMTDFLFLLLNSRSKSDDRHYKWVFPSHYKNGEHLSNPYKAISKIEGFKLSPHDFRRTFATATRELGIKKEDLSTLLNHAKGDVTEGYVFASLSYKEKNLDAIFDYYNNNSNDALRWMMVNWYEGNPELFIPSPIEETSGINRAKERKYLLAENEKD
jgi:integrase